MAKKFKYWCFRNYCMIFHPTQIIEIRFENNWFQLGDIISTRKYKAINIGKGWFYILNKNN